MTQPANSSNLKIILLFCIFLLIPLIIVLVNLGPSRISVKTSSSDTVIIYQKLIYPDISTNSNWKFTIKDSINVTQKYKVGFTKEVEATIYHATEGQTNSQPLRTASGLKISSTYNAYSHRYLAVSQDFIKSGKLAYGDLILVSNISIPEYNGIWIVADCMNGRFTNKVDLLVNPNMKGDYWYGKRKITIMKLNF